MTYGNNLFLFLFFKISILLKIVKIIFFFYYVIQPYTSTPLLCYYIILRKKQRDDFEPFLYHLIFYYTFFNQIFK
jgi:hypothetical protein